MKMNSASFVSHLFSSAYAFDWAQNEAQFIGKVSDLRVVADYLQNLENGKDIPGYLIQRDGSIFLD